MKVPFFRPELTPSEIEAVVETLRSGWLTTGPRVARFEERFAEAVGARNAVALNSCTAAMHVASVALGLTRGQGVLVPTMTFAATAEIILYAGAYPILVDCDSSRLHLDLEDAERKIARAEHGDLPGLVEPLEVVGIIPVHTAGLMVDVRAVQELAERHRLWVVDDAAHAFPAAQDVGTADAPSWQSIGCGTADVSTFSFYANKTITTGEGGMATTDDDQLAAQMRSLSLHGLSSDAWGRYSSKGSWDYRILAPGYKYNLTDIAAALGLEQLAAAEELRVLRERVAHRYLEGFDELASAGLLELPETPPDRLHSWHLFQIKFPAGALSVHRDDFAAELRERGIGFSVHWRPLHLHPYYRDTGWTAQDLPVASEVWERTLSLPIFPRQRPDEVDAVIDTVARLVQRHKA